MDLDEALHTLARQPSAPLDVAELALLVARDEYPQLDIEAAQAELAAMAREVRPRLRGGLTARVQALSSYLFEEQGLRGNKQDYYDPRNSYLNDVLDRRLGLPITLAVLAIAVGTRAGLPVFGVGLPGHFIAKAVQRNEEVYFDPFNGGQVLSIESCALLVEQMCGVPFEVTPAALQAVSPGALLARLLTNLKGAYLRLGDFNRAARVIGRLRQLCPDDASQTRDLGIVLLQAGRPGQAIRHLQSYLALNPPPPDGREVRELLNDACAQVARWN
jgi:regulator of sirC expression with transglutaminase-like and TPR domain